MRPDDVDEAPRRRVLGQEVAVVVAVTLAHLLAQPVVVGVFEKQPHFSGSELFGWPATVEPVAEALLQRWIHSDGSGAMSLTPRS